MRSVNKVIIIGNVTRDADSRTSSNGQIITTFGIATNRYWMTTDGQKRNSTEFHEVVAWSRLAEICQKMVKKGIPVYIEGYLKTRTWENEGGVRMRKTEIIAQDLIMLERNNKEDSDIHLGDNNSEIENKNPLSIDIELLDEMIDPSLPIDDFKPSTPKAPSVSSSNDVNIDDDLGL